MPEGQTDEECGGQLNGLYNVAVLYCTPSLISQKSEIFDSFPPGEAFGA